MEFHLEMGLDEARQCRQRLEEAFLDAYFARNIPPHTLEISDNSRRIYEHHLRAEGGYSSANVAASIQRYNEGALANHPQRETQTEEELWLQYPQTTQTGGVDYGPPPVQASEGQETVVDAGSEHEWRDGEHSEDAKKEGQSLLNLLYHIAEDQARRDGYVHRGVICNSCNARPIRGIRYRCANCIDFDLCEQCEAMQIHPKTHLFYKVRIPAPFLGSPRPPQPVWYPGKPSISIQNLPREIITKFCNETGFQTSEIEALWDQFRCLAATELTESPDHYSLAIDRRTFDKCFVPNSTARLPPPSLIYDRMFAFYDTNGDGLISFEEFIKGLASLTKRNRDERQRRIFQGYDIDRDGYVDRKDFLRMFRAFYAFSKELSRDIVTGMEEDVLEAGGAREIIMSSQPISSAFSGAIPPGEPSRTNEWKTRDENGDDVVIFDNVDTVKESEDDVGDHNEILADAAEKASFPGKRFEQSMITPFQEEQTLVEALELGFDPIARAALDEEDYEQENGGPDDALRLLRERWPPDYVVLYDVKNALGRDLDIQDIRESEDRINVRNAARKRIKEETRRKRRYVRHQGVSEHWRRGKFYLDGEDGFVPPEDFEYIARSFPSDDKELVDDPVRSRMATLEAILQSQLMSLFQTAIKRRLRELGWANERFEVEDYANDFIWMLSNGATTEEMATEASTSGFENAPSYGEATEFAQWLCETIEDYGAEVKAETPENVASPATRRSRSSSKVRFQDDLTDGEHETRSTTSMSSRSIPMGERWGGYEIPEAEKDVGREILYQVTQEALNELLDPLFKRREDLAMLVLRTRYERKKWRSQISQLTTSGTKKHLEALLEKNEKSWRRADGTEAVVYDSPVAEAARTEHQIGQEETQSDHPTHPKTAEPPTMDPSTINTDLHRALAALNRPISSTEESTYNPPLSLSLTHFGYNTSPTTSTTPAPDPTLPQNRPNTLSSNPLSAANAASNLEASAHLRPHDPLYTQLMVPPSRERVAYLAMLDYVERVDGERGGPGRLSLEEFEEVMRGGRGGGLGFVGSWIEMAGF